MFIRVPVESADFCFMLLNDYNHQYNDFIK